MGLIALLKSFTRVVRNGAQASDVKIDPSGGANLTVEHFAPPGDDSNPLPNDFVVAVSIPRTGGWAAVGYIDPLNVPKAAPGEKRIYARDPSDGSDIVDLWLKNDGTGILSNANGSVTLSPDGGIKGDNGSGSFELQSGGNFVVNGVIIDANGNITTTGTITGGTIAATSSMTVAGKEMGGHTHAQGNDSNGDTQVNTGGPV